MRLGLVGYGKGGRYFHAPFIEAAEGVEFVGVVTTNPQRRAEVAADFPGMPVFDTLEALIDAGVDAVTITTPPQTRRELVLRALERGVHVVADKPFAPSAAAAQELVDAASAAGRALNVFHNRRWDADLRTLQGVIDSGELGEIWRVEARFELDEPETLDAGPTGGLLRDLGTHLVDQMQWLLGPVTSVYTHLDWIDLPAGRTDAAFSIVLNHASGTQSRVTATKVNHHAEKELRAYGSGGSYIAHSTDVQAQAVFAGRRPVDEGKAWGHEDESRWGVLSTASGARAVPSARGAYQDYYTQFAAAVRGEAQFPVPGEEGVATLAVLDAARVSAAENRVVDVS